ERVAKTRVRFKAAVEDDVVEVRAIADLREGPGQSAAPAPRGEAHPVMLVEPTTRAFRCDAQFTQIGGFDWCVGGCFDALHECGGPLWRRAVGLQWPTAFTRPIAREPAVSHRAEEFDVLRIGPRWAGGPAKNPGGIYRYVEYAVVIGVFVMKSAHHFPPVRKERHGLIFFHTLNVSRRSTEKAMLDSKLLL